MQKQQYRYFNKSNYSGQVYRFSETTEPELLAIPMNELFAYSKLSNPKEQDFPKYKWEAGSWNKQYLIDNWNEITLEQARKYMPFAFIDVGGE